MASALVIPCHIRSKWDLKCLLRLLDSVRDQSTPFSRVYVVDDASPLKYSLADRDVEHIVLETNGGPARARNVAVAKALTVGHEFIFFTDHDCILDRGWHGHMARFLTETNFAAVGGMTYSWGSTLLDRYHDVNGDGVVNKDDYDGVIQPLKGTLIGDPGYVVEADLDRDGKISSDDYDVCIADDGQKSSGGVGEAGLFSAGVRNSVGYCGYIYNEDTGLYTVRYRTYSAMLGRWLTRDPLGYVDSLNLSSYCHEAPPNYVDPYGSQIRTTGRTDYSEGERPLRLGPAAPAAPTPKTIIVCIPVDDEGFPLEFPEGAALGLGYELTLAGQLRLNYDADVRVLEQRFGHCPTSPEACRARIALQDKYRTQLSALFRAMTQKIKSDPERIRRAADLMRRIKEAEAAGTSVPGANPFRSNPKITRMGRVFRGCGTVMLCFSVGIEVYTVASVPPEDRPAAAGHAAGRLAGGAIGGAGGAWLGAKCGAGLGAFGGPIGVGVGAIGGGIIGVFAGDWLAGLICGPDPANPPAPAHPPASPPPPATRREWMPSYCFVAGTLVSTPQGRVAIETIRDSDAVFGWDESTNTVVVATVTRTMTGTSDNLYAILVSGKNGDELIRATGSHPVYVANRGWTSVNALHAGDVLLCRNGEARVVSISTEFVTAQVFNLSVDPCKTYFVGSLEIICHNKPPGLRDRSTGRRLADHPCQFFVESAMVDTSEFAGILSVALSALGTGRDVPWNCFAVGYHEPMFSEGRKLDSTPQPPYSDFAKIVTLIDGCPDGTLLFWCCAVGRNELTSLAIEIHVHNDIPRELIGGRFWRDAAEPRYVCRSPCLSISPELIHKARELESRPSKPSWFDRIFRRV